MERKLWTLAFFLAFLKPQLQFYDWNKESGTLGTHGCNPMEIKLSTISHPPLGASGNAYSCGTLRIPLPLAAGKDKPCLFVFIKLPSTIFHLCFHMAVSFPLGLSNRPILSIKIGHAATIPFSMLDVS